MAGKHVTLTFAFTCSGDNALMRAARKGDMDTVQILLNEGSGEDVPKDCENSRVVVPGGTSRHIAPYKS